MMTATLDVNSADRLRLATRLFTEGLGKEIGPLLKDVGKKLSIEFIEKTPPFGSGNAAKKLGENAVKRDLLRTITPASVVWNKKNTDKKLFKRIKEITAKKDKPAMEAIIKNTPAKQGWQVKDFHPSIHTSKRVYGGRYRVKESLKNVTMDESQFSDYQNTVVNRVGYSKASWGKIVAILGGKTKIWIARHFGYAKGGVIDRTDNEGYPMLILVNRTPNITKHISAYNQSVGVVADRMLRDIAFKVEYLAKQNRLMR